MMTIKGQETNDKKVLYSDMVLKTCFITVEDKELSVDLIVLDMDEYEVILGRDWLSKYHIKIDCRKKIVVFHPLQISLYLEVSRLAQNFL